MAECTSLLYFIVRVRCRRTESKRSLSHLLMSFLLYIEEDLPYGGVWHAQRTLDMDPVRGTTVCEVNAMERGTSCCNSVVGTSRQKSCCSSHGYRCRLFTSLLTDSCTWRRRDEEVRNRFLANVNSRSRSLYAIAHPSVVCNVRAPYSDD